MSVYALLREAPEPPQPEWRPAWPGALRWAARVFHDDDLRLKFYNFIYTGKPSIELVQDADRDPDFVANPWLPWGRDLMWKSANTYYEYYSSLPQQCRALFDTVSSKFTHRRKDALRNILYIAEAVCHRAAFEREGQVLFSYDSLIMWVRLAKNHNIGGVTLKTALNYLNESEFFDVTLGQKGHSNKCTRIKLAISSHDLADYQATCDWQADIDWVMTKVHDREADVQEQRVLESQQAERLLYDTLNGSTLK